MVLAGVDVGYLLNTWAAWIFLYGAFDVTRWRIFAMFPRRLLVRCKRIDAQISSFGHVKLKHNLGNFSVRNLLTRQPLMTFRIK